MKKQRILTGIKPTGVPHLGNYLGAIRPSIEMSLNSDLECFYFLADSHALTTVKNKDELKQSVLEVASCWLALGLDPDKTFFYRQSDISEIFELNWILSNFCSKGLMNRAHAYKALVANNLENNNDNDEGINMGIFTYPVLMSADILALNAHKVPVGKDQVQHLEMCRDMVQVFNQTYKSKFLNLPVPVIEKDSAVVPGTDGKKMSKSYNNTIPLFLAPKKLKKVVNKIVTDSLPPEAPKDPETSSLFNYYTLFASNDDIETLREDYKKGIGWGHVKERLFSVLEETFGEKREIYNEYLNNPKKVHAILDEGANKVRPLANDVLKNVKDICGF